MLRVLTLALLAAGYADEKNRPVTKVINLLKDMQKQLEKEAKEDKEVYDKVACWCKTNDKEKSQAIKDAEMSIQQLQSSIEEFAAQTARLKEEIENLNKEVAANEQALNQATKLREKQSSQFSAEEKDLIQSVQALKSAVVVLSKHHTTEFLQGSNSPLKGIATMLSIAMAKYSDSIEITPSQKETIDTFIQSPFQSYAPQSGEIFGILKQMQENFEQNLSSSQKEEIENQKAYQGLKDAKQTEIRAGKDQIDEKTSQLADSVEKHAQAKQEIEDTTNSLSSDEIFLMDLKKRCKLTDEEWAERQKSRNDEVVAVGEAISVLAGDDAHDTFTKTFNNFVQVKQIDSNRSKAIKMLQKAAKKFDDPNLSVLAGRMQLDAFTKVKQAIDEMVTQLQQEKADEIKHRDWCIVELNDSEKERTRTGRDHDDQVSKIADLDEEIITLKATLENSHKQIAELHVQLKRIGEDRAAENTDFQTTVSDQRETQVLLKKAYDHLAKVYAGKSFLEDAPEKNPPPPEGFKAYKKNEGGTGVLLLLQQIINDAKAMEAEATRAEQDSQEAYESFVKETNRSIEAKTRGIVNAQEEKSKKEVYMSESKKARKGLEIQLEQLSKEEADVHKSCDFVLKNFEARQTARDEEVEALAQAKAILSGASFGFLQKHITITK